MKKCNVLLIILMVGSFFLLIKEDVQASVKRTVKISHPDNIYYTLTGGGKNISKQFTHYSLDGDVVYCIEPGVQITDWDYIGEEGFVNSPFSDEINKKMELIGYYGYDYPEHQTEKYRMATQALIWESVGDHTVKFYTKANAKGDLINIDQERQTIINLVNSHYNKPSFCGKTFNTKLGENLVIEDTNNILNEYMLLNNGGSDVTISNNKITVYPKTFGDTEITLIRKKYDDRTTIIFNGENGSSQKLGFFRASDSIIATIKLNTTGGVVSIEKTDSETGLSQGQGDTTLEGAVYGIYDENDVLLTKLTTNKNGKATSSNLNKIGKFTLKEISPSKGYLLDENVYSFEINVNNPNVTLKVKEQVIKHNLKIRKVLSNNAVGIIDGEANVSFDVYLKSTGKLYKIITTDKDGYANIDLPFGTYIFKQKNTTKDYQKVDDFEFKVNEVGSTTKTLYDRAIEAKLKVVKIDAETGEVIKMSGIKFRIKSLKTNEYICPDLYMPRSLNACTYSTDENGIMVTPFELVGDYQLEEVDQMIDGYLWNDKKINFHIGEGSQFELDEHLGKLFVVKFPNASVKGSVEINKIGEQVIINDGTYSYEEVKLANVKFGLYDENNNLVREVVTDKNGYTKIEGLKLGKYFLKELESVNNNVVDKTSYEFELKYKDQYTPIITKTFSFKNNYSRGILEFTKLDLSTSSPLPNTKIEIYTDKDQLVFSGITDENGKITINNLFVGKFYILEKEAPEGYILNTEKMYFEIKENGELIKAKMTNKKITSTLKITKLDENNKILSGVKFGIYDLEDKLIKEVTTDENGLIEIELEYGKYYFKEINTLDEYVISGEKVYFEIKEDGAILEKNVINEYKKGTLEFTKNDLITGEVIPNTLIEIYTDKDELIYTGKTDEKGKVVINELKYGKYYIIEKEPSTGFVITEEKVYFEIKENGEIVKAQMTNRPILGTLEFTKVDISTSEPLPNTLIEIYTDKDELVFSGRTDENGKVIIEQLRYGKYYVLEKQAPDGYILNEEKMFFEIKEDGEIVKTTMVNEKVIVEVPSTGLNNHYIYEIVSGALVLSGIGVIIYAKKKRKK